MADLRSLDPLAGHTSALLRGYFTPEDGGGGTFAWDGTSQAVDDGGLVIEPAVLVRRGRWKRVYSGPVLLDWFGLQGGADAGPTLQSLFSAFADGERGSFRVLPGDYLSSVPLVLPNPSNQEWDLAGVRLTFDAAVTGVLFEIGDSGGTKSHVFDTIVRAPMVIHAHADDLDVAPRGSAEETIGIRATNLYHSFLYGVSASYCSIGFQAFATDLIGNVYNEFHLGSFKNCRVSVRPSIDKEGAGGTGWSNENLYLGGRFWDNWTESETLLEAFVILPGGFSCNQNVFLKPAFEGAGPNAVRMIASANVILHPRPEFKALGGTCLHLDGEDTSVIAFPDATVAVNPASTGNLVEMLYWDGDVEPYASGEPAALGNRWRTREGSFLSLGVVGDGGSFDPQRLLERGASIQNDTPLDLLRDLYANSGVPWGRRYESARSAVSESVAIGGLDRYQRHHYDHYMTERIGSRVEMQSDAWVTPAVARILAGGASEPFAAGDGFTGADGVRWRHTGTAWQRTEPVHLSDVVIGTSSTAFAHGLPYTPTEVSVLPQANAVVWRSAPATSSHVFVQASEVVTADVYVR